MDREAPNLSVVLFDMPNHHMITIDNHPFPICRIPVDQIQDQAHAQHVEHGKRQDHPVPQKGKTQGYTEADDNEQHVEQW